MELEDALHDAQAQPTASVALVKTAEWLGNLLSVRFINSRTLIDNANLRPAVDLG